MAEQTANAGAQGSGPLDLIVIGGGPAGYVGAIRAAQLGLKTACVERDKLGGTCLNWGCIPTKALLESAEFYRRVKHEAGEWGVHVPAAGFEFEKIIGRSRTVAGNLNKGVTALFKKNKIAHHEGQAKITKPGTVEVRDAAGKVTATLTAKNILIATGAGPRQLPGAPFDGQKILSSKEAMTLSEQPKDLIIIGAGAIGMEFAYFYHCLGTKVTVIEMLDRLLPIEDDEVSKAVERSFRKLGVTTMTATKTLEVRKTNAGVEVTVAPVADEKQTQKLTADKVLVAIGVQGRYDGLFDASLGVQTEKNHIVADKKTYRTSVPGIYAVGDVIGPPWLAHVASEEAIVCVELLAGHHAEPVDYSAIPGCTYCQPQVASIGQTERALQAKGLKPNVDYKVGKFPFTASGRAQAAGHTEGFVKLLSGAKHGEILGCHMVGDHVTELIAEVGLAIRLEATAEELIATMHAHPTLSEAVHEAALGLQGRMIHF
ncbi:MAG: dihydrolipoyl dehydrogenase [Phycisphaeraceae bacterium]|nr:dihydrolipoyl dehydrogenase [Phycisphaeraceae bacterium]